jgi:hypothetical protein
MKKDFFIYFSQNIYFFLPSLQNTYRQFFCFVKFPAHNSFEFLYQPVVIKIDLHFLLLFKRWGWVQSWCFGREKIYFTFIQCISLRKTDTENKWGFLNLFFSFTFVSSKRAAAATVSNSLHSQRTISKPTFTNIHFSLKCSINFAWTMNIDNNNRDLTKKTSAKIGYFYVLTLGHKIWF